MACWRLNSHGLGLRQSAAWPLRLRSRTHTAAVHAHAACTHASWQRHQQQQGAGAARQAQDPLCRMMSRPDKLQGLVVHGRSKKRHAESQHDQQEEAAPVDHSRRIEALSSALGVSLEHVTSLITQQPALTSLPLEALVIGVQSLAAHLSLPMAQALVMAARQPALVGAQMEELLAKVDVLGVALGFPAEQAAFLAARQPAMLEYAPDQLSAACARLASVLGVSQRGMGLLLAKLKDQELRLVLGMSASYLSDRLEDIRESVALPLGSTRGMDVLRMVVRHPGLLAVSPASLSMSCEALLEAYQAAPGTFVVVLGRCPSLLTYPAEAIRANLAGLLRHLAVPREALVKMLIAQPQLLHVTPDSLLLKLEALTYQLYIPKQQVLDMCCRQPALLLLHPNNIASKATGLQQLLGISYPMALSLMATNPTLPLRNLDSLRAKRDALAALLGVPVGAVSALMLQHPGLLTHRAELLAEVWEVLAAGTGASRAELAAIVLGQPWILLAGPRALQDNLYELQQALDLSHVEVGALVRKNPAILQAPSSAWRLNLAALRYELGLPKEAAAAVVQQHPRLLRLPRGQLVGTCQGLLAAIAPVPSWREQLQGLRPKEVAACLRLDESGLEHLAFLAERARPNDPLPCMHHTIYHRPSFRRQHKSFSTWLRHRRRRQAQLQAAPVSPAASPATDEQDWMLGATGSEEEEWDEQQPLGQAPAAPTTAAMQQELQHWSWQREPPSSAWPRDTRSPLSSQDGGSGVRRAERLQPRPQRTPLRQTAGADEPDALSAAASPAAGPALPQAESSVQQEDEARLLQELASRRAVSAAGDASVDASKAMVPSLSGAQYNRR